MASVSGGAQQAVQGCGAGRRLLLAGQLHGRKAREYGGEARNWRWNADDVPLKACTRLRKPVQMGRPYFLIA